MNGDCNICINGKLPSYSASCVECGLLRKNYKPMTNADRIRSMTDEELAEFLWKRDIQIVERASKAAGFNYHYDEAQCRQNISDWLKAPVEVEK